MTATAKRWKCWTCHRLPKDHPCTDCSCKVFVKPPPAGVIEYKLTRAAPELLEVTIELLAITRLECADPTCIVCKKRQALIDRARAAIDSTRSAR